MKVRVFAVFVLLVAAVSLVAEPPVRKTIVIKDGQMLVDGKMVDLNEQMFGGKRAYLGVSLIDLTSELREHYGAPKDVGVLVSSVAPDSPAAKAGIQAGDIVLGVDGKDSQSSSDIRKALRDKKQGDSARVEVLRGRTRQTLVASVVEREGVRVMMPDVEELTKRFDSPEWRARLERIGPDCEKLQTRIKDLELRLKDLEKKLK